ncbi:phage tail protein [Tenacibaculum larymnensis]|uniref:Tail fiber protein n=1 Tax=Tenacibaculum larymnensis TaxID=2878201 RepID=A0A9X4ERP1_9FLAO|nr:tail fiber protein [Tenacibaculum larymnensis]MDE1205561.1 tail fiber protein [Tenacibaculum larymnensis]
MKQSKEILKTYFETGDRPTESQFVDLIDTLNTPFIGELKTVSFNIVPEGWAICNGQLLNIAEHQELFSLIGKTYGGDGVSTFALPDLRGRVPLGVGSNSELSNHLLGQHGGEETTILNSMNLPSHSHTASFTQTSGVSSIPAVAEEANNDDPTNNKLAIPNISGSNRIYSNATADTSLAKGTATVTGTVEVSSVGNQEPFSNMQPYLSVNYIIALEGRVPVPKIN